MFVQLTRSSLLRRALALVAAIAVVAVAADLLANAADSGTTPHERVVEIKPAKKNVALRLVAGTVSVQDTGPPATVGPPVRRALLHAAQLYVDDAILAPLTHGRVDNAYETVFDAGVAAVASGPDRAVLTEAGTGAASAGLYATASPVRFDAIGDPHGQLALVATTFGLSVRASTPAGPLTVTRITELTFAPEFGRWRVTAYNVTVRRSVGSTTTSKRVSTGRAGPNGVAA